uniref:Retrotransposon Copia-like N-terminal domain-containing protein n=1 Tax=Fagus sylvatica TaxID=28930 RepID=A0A2N9ELB8_FAGSY
MASGSSSFSGTSATVMGDDSSNPYFLYHEESLRMSLVKQPLTKENYHSWSRLMVIALTAKNKIGSVNGSITAPGISSPLYNAWERCNLGSTGTAKWAPYRYRVRRGYVYRWGTAACVPQAYPISAKKKNFRYGFGTGPVRVGSGPPLDLTPLGLRSRFSLLYSLSLTSSTAGELGLCSALLSVSALRVSLLCSR